MPRRLMLHAPLPLVARAGAFALTLAAFAAGAAPVRAADHYMAVGLPFFAPYRVAIVTVEVAGGKATGTIAPPAGDPRPAVPFTGTLVNGNLKVNVGEGPETYVLTFNEGERGLHQVWDEAVTVGGLDRIILFRPAADFSPAALALQHIDEDWCGQVYGGLSVVLRADALKAQAAAPAALADLDVRVAGPAAGGGLVKLKDIWSRLRLAARNGEDLPVDIVVPLGSEVTTATALRAERAVAAVGLPVSCAEMALAVVPKDRVFENGALSDTLLKSYLEGALGRLLSGAPAESAAAGPRRFRLTDAAIGRSATGAPVFTVRVTGESEATRLAKGNWDQFTLTLQPMVTATDAGDTISLIPTIGDLKVARRASGQQMPAETAFRPVEDDDVIEAAIIHRLVSWLAASEKSRCDFLTAARFDEPDNAYSCENIELDDVSHPEDN